MGVSFPLRPENQPTISREEEDARVDWVLKNLPCALDEEGLHAELSICGHGDVGGVVRRRLLERWYPGPPHIMTGEPLRTYLNCLDFENWKKRPVVLPEHLPVEAFEKIACFYPDGPVVLIRTGEILESSFSRGQPSIMVFLKALNANPDWRPPEPDSKHDPVPAVNTTSFFAKLCCLA